MIAATPPSARTVGERARGALELLELAVDGDAQRLEGARRGIDAALRFGPRHADTARAQIARSSRAALVRRRA